MPQLTNCKPCLGDKHGDCTNNFCLCEDNNHGLRKHDLGDSINWMMDALVATVPIREKANTERIKKYGRPINQIENYLKTIIKNDEKLIEQLLQVYLSAYTNNPINMALLAPSSEGKTFAIVEVSKIFPKKDIILVGRLSPTALIHQNGFLIDENGNNIEDQILSLESNILNADSSTRKSLERELNDLRKNARVCIDLQHKILLFMDNPHPQTYEMLKPIMSHDSKEIEYMTTGDKLKVKKSVIRNWPVFVFASAKNEDSNEVWKEIKTRVFQATPNSDLAKYHEANKATAFKLSRPTWATDPAEIDAERWAKFYVSDLKNQLIEQCKENNNPITNVFDEILAEQFPHKQGVDMRHFRRFIDFVNLQTLINSQNNPELIFEHKDGRKIKSIFTTIQDIDEACDIIGDITTVAPRQIKWLKEIFEPCVASILNGDNGVTTKHLVEYSLSTKSIKISAKQVLENHCWPLAQLGVLESKQNPDNVSQNLYTKENDSATSLDGLKKKLIETSKHDFSFVDSCLENMEKVSMGIRNSPITYRYAGKEIDLVTLKEILLCNSQNQSKPQEI